MDGPRPMLWSRCALGCTEWTWLYIYLSFHKEPMSKIHNSGDIGHISQCVSDQDLAGHKLHPFLSTSIFHGIMYLIRYTYIYIHSTIIYRSYSTAFLLKHYARQRSLSRRSIVNAQARQLLEPLETELVPVSGISKGVGKCPSVSKNCKIKSHKR